MKVGREKNRRPLNRSITIGCVVFIIILCVLLSLANLSIYRNYVYSDYRGYITDILALTMDYIDGDDLKSCIETGVESPRYKETLLSMDNLIDHFSDIHYLYAVRPLNTEETGSVMSVLSAERYYDRYIDTEGNLYLGWISDDEYDSETAAQLFEIMNGDGIVFFEEQTEWGTDYTGAVPIRDSSGEGIAVLAVDIDISFINDMIKEYALVNIGIIAASGLIFIGIFLLWSRRNITIPIRQLEQSAVCFADHSHGQRDVEALSFDAPDIKANNEIKSLSDAVVKMTEDMREYVSEIISVEKIAENMEVLANRDPLTGIRNKTAYDTEIRRLQEGIETGEKKIGLAVVDLNYLKRINDTYGHEKGNVAIKKLCSVICAIFDHSPVFRIGGDEFAVVLRGTDYDNCETLTARFYEIIHAMAEEETLEPWEKVSAAIGFAFYDESLDDDINSVFRRADHSMYEQKKSMKAVREE
ncbi:MAG: sensor domain-containing diguanylate cyclase [Oscillospiraceae bacterium]|nr:sensor domain-containing diguanylate cyclase [Oscillospiraceae bacterium]